MIVFDNHFIIIYFILVITALVLSGFSLRILLKKRIRHPIEVLKDRIAIMRIKNDYIKSGFGEIENLPADIKEITQEFELLLIDLQRKHEAEFKSALSDFAVQVAHDIGSALAVLEILIQSSSISLPEDSRILISNIASRIRNISNSLYVKVSDIEKPIVKDGLPLENFTKLQIPE